MMNVRVVLLSSLLMFFILDAGGEKGKRCPEIKYEHGKMKIRGRGKTARYRCKKSFTIFGSKKATCQETGSWDNPPPLCIKSGCPPLGPFTYMEMKEKKEGAMLEFVCAGGTKLNGSKYITCNGKEWSDSVPTCEEADSKLSKPVITAKINNVTEPGSDPTFKSTLKKYNSRANVNALSPTTPQTTTISTRASKPKSENVCREIKIENGMTTIKRNGKRARYTCKDGFRLEGEQVARCQDTGSWSHPPPLCIKRGCPTLGPFPNMEIHIIYNGAKLLFECRNGTKHKGPETITCNGKEWSDVAPTCEVRKSGRQKTKKSKSPTTPTQQAMTTTMTTTRRQKSYVTERSETTKSVISSLRTTADTDKLLSISNGYVVTTTQQTTKTKTTIKPTEQTPSLEKGKKDGKKDTLEKDQRTKHKSTTTKGTTKTTSPPSTRIPTMIVTTKAVFSSPTTSQLITGATTDMTLIQTTMTIKPTVSIKAVTDEVDITTSGNKDSLQKGFTSPEIYSSHTVTVPEAIESTTFKTLSSESLQSSRFSTETGQATPTVGKTTVPTPVSMIHKATETYHPSTVSPMTASYSISGETMKTSPETYSSHTVTVPEAVESTTFKTISSESLQSNRFSTETGRATPTVGRTTVPTPVSTIHKATETYHPSTVSPTTVPYSTSGKTVKTTHHEQTTTPVDTTVSTLSNQGNDVTTSNEPGKSALSTSVTNKPDSSTTVTEEFTAILISNPGGSRQRTEIAFASVRPLVIGITASVVVQMVVMGTLVWLWANNQRKKQEKEAAADETSIQVIADSTECTKM